MSDTNDPGPGGSGPEASQRPTVLERIAGWPLWVRIGVPALVVVLVIGALAGDDSDDEAVNTAPPETTAAPTTTPEPTTTSESQPTTTESPATTAEPTTTTAAPTTTTEAPTTTTTEVAIPSFGGGTQLVGSDVQPGVYLAEDVSFCYWERLSGLSGDFGDIITNGNAEGQAVVEIFATDVAFSSQGCGRWVAFLPPAEPATSFGDGDWVVGAQIAPGRYRATAGGFCYWERASGFGHDFGEILANDNVEAGTNAIVEIRPGDRRFTSSGCGTWSVG